MVQTIWVQCYFVIVQSIWVQGYVEMVQSTIGVEYETCSLVVFRHPFRGGHQLLLEVTAFT